MPKKIHPVNPPGDTIRDELEARNWSQADLAVILGRPVQFVSELCNGKKLLTPITAKQLAAAMGTTAEFWINLESAYRLSIAPDADPAIARRAARLTCT